MIAARTGMERMPEHCTECRERRCRFTVQGTRYCRLTSRTIPDTGRATWCPLTEIDETLPAQLAAAEKALQDNAVFLAVHGVNGYSVAISTGETGKPGPAGCGVMRKGEQGECQ